MQEELKIPKERVAVLIGRNGNVKRLIQNRTKTKLEISSEGDVTIYGDSLNVYLTQKIIKAIARGCNPDIALTLLNESNTLEVIEIPEIIGKSKSKLIRIRARLIGTKGKARENIEEMTNTHIIIYGKTVAIIGNIENVMIARNAIIHLILGSKHGNVYHFIEKQKRVV